MRVHCPAKRVTYVPSKKRRGQTIDDNVNPHNPGTAVPFWERTFNFYMLSLLPLPTCKKLLPYLEPLEKTTHVLSHTDKIEMQRCSDLTLATHPVLLRPVK